MGSKIITNVELASYFPELYNSMNEQEKNSIIYDIRVWEYQNGDYVFKSDQEIRLVYFILHGKVKIQKSNATSDKQQILHLLHQGDIFGLHSSFEHMTVQTEAIALDKSIIATIPITTITRLLHANAELAYYTIERITRATNTLEQRMICLTHKHMRGRMADSILYLKKIFGVLEQTNTIDVKLTRQEMASLSDMTLSNAIRTLSAFCKENVISLKGRKLTILDEGSLQRISRFE